MKKWLFSSSVLYRRKAGLRFMTASLILLFYFFLFPFSFFLPSAHTQNPSDARGVLRLKVKYKSGETSRELARKRFFLIKGSLDENKSLIERIKQTSPISRECYYRSKKASEALIKWLKENDCESVYCRDIEDRYITSNDAVPEFRAAYDAGLREFKTPELARQWLPVNLAVDIRAGFYNEKQKTISTLISGLPSVASVMTDRHGSAYLTDIEPGVYTISNLVASETEKTTILWACEKEIKATDLATAIRRPFTLSNEKDPKIKCEIVERPLPVCAQ